jgi:hypothetical protein
MPARRGNDTGRRMPPQIAAKQDIRRAKSKLADAQNDDG